MIDMPVTGEQRFDDFITLKFKRVGEGMNESKLLQQIQPTVEKQKEDDQVNLERSTSTTSSHVEQNYTANELKAEYARLKSEFDETMNPQESDGATEFPRVENRNRKEFWANAICAGRRLLINSCQPGEWEQNTKDRIQQQIESRSAEATSQIQERLNRIGESNFFHLCVDTAGSTLRTDYSEKHMIPAEQPQQQQQPQHQPQQQQQPQQLPNWVNALSVRTSVNNVT